MEHGWESSGDRGWASSGWTAQEWPQPVGASQPSPSSVVSAVSTSVGPSYIGSSSSTIQGILFRTKGANVFFSIGTSPFNKNNKMEQIHSKLRPQLNVRHRSCYACMSKVVWITISYIRMEKDIQTLAQQMELTCQFVGFAPYFQRAFRQERGSRQHLYSMRRSRTKCLIQPKLKAMLWMITDKCMDGTSLVAKISRYQFIKKDITSI